MVMPWGEEERMPSQVRSGTQVQRKGVCFYEAHFLAIFSCIDPAPGREPETGGKGAGMGRSRRREGSAGGRRPRSVDGRSSGSEACIQSWTQIQTLTVSHASHMRLCDLQLHHL